MISSAGSFVPLGAGLMTVKPLMFVEAGEGLTMLFDRGAVITRGEVLLLRSPPPTPVAPAPVGLTKLFVRIGICVGTAGAGNGTADCGAFGTWAKEEDKIPKPKTQIPKNFQTGKRPNRGVCAGHNPCSAVPGFGVPALAGSRVGLCVVFIVCWMLLFCWSCPA